MNEKATKDGSSKEPAEAEDGRKARKHKKRAAGVTKESDEVQADIVALNDRLLRLQADFENFRKRTLREKGEVHKRANEELMLEMLPVLDHLDLALSHLDENGGNSAFAEGIKLVAEQLLAVLGKFGLAVVDAAGAEFDPNLHEAVSHLPSDGAPENHVVEQTRKGYLLGNRLLRPAQVVVSSGPTWAAGMVSELEGQE